MNFEQSKNTKALAWTVGIHVALLLLFLTLKYTLPAQPKEDDMAMEINLGTSDNGYGDDQPEVPEDPAAPNEVALANNTQGNTEANSKDYLTTNDADAASINTTPKKDNVVRKPIDRNNRNRNNTVTPVTNANSNKNTTQETPKFTYPGSNGKGGNSAANNRPGGNEGIGTGNGDMGTPGGTPGAKNYFGIAVRLGDRKMIARPNPNATFNHAGSVKVKITVNREGIIESYNIVNSKSAELTKIVEQKIKSVRFNKVSNPPEQIGFITFDFRTR